MPRDEIVGYLESYALTSNVPVREGVDVESLEPGVHARLLLRASSGEMHTDTVVGCSGAYQRAHRPDVAASLPRSCG